MLCGGGEVGTGGGVGGEPGGFGEVGKEEGEDRRRVRDEKEETGL